MTTGKTIALTKAMPFPYPGDLPNTAIEPRSPTLQTDSLPSEPPGHIPIQLFQQIVKRFSFLHWFAFIPLLKINRPCMCGYISGLYSVPQIFVYLDTNITLL